MSNLMLNIDMRGRVVLIVGGGQVAHRKALSLLDAGACVRLVAPALVDELQAMVQDGLVACRVGRYEPPDLADIFLVVAATDSKDVNASVAEDAARLGILANVADAPELSSCTFPALLRRGGLEVAVATGGGCPAFAAQVRDVIAGVIGTDYGAALEQLAAEREKLLTEGKGSTYNSQVLRELARQLIKELEDKERVP